MTRVTAGVGGRSYSGRVTFCIRIAVRSYELDALGHVNHAVYHSYAEVARFEGFAAAGCGFEELTAAGYGPVMLESHIVFRRELVGRDVVDVTCEVKFGTGKTFQLEQVITKADGTVAAEITSTAGIMDLKARKLVDDPRALLESIGADLRVVSAAE